MTAPASPSSDLDELKARAALALDIADDAANLLDQMILEALHSATVPMFLAAEGLKDARINLSTVIAVIEPLRQA